MSEQCQKYRNPVGSTCNNVHWNMTKQCKTHAYTSAYVLEHMSEHLSVLLPKLMSVYMSLKLYEHTPRVFSEEMPVFVNTSLTLYTLQNLQPAHVLGVSMRRNTVNHQDTTGWGLFKSNSLSDQQLDSFVCIASLSWDSGLLVNEQSRKQGLVCHRVAVNSWRCAWLCQDSGWSLLFVQTAPSTFRSKACVVFNMIPALKKHVLSLKL